MENRNKAFSRPMHAAAKENENSVAIAGIP